MEYLHEDLHHDHSLFKCKHCRQWLYFPLEIGKPCPGPKRKSQKPPVYQIGEHVEYFLRGICYPGIIREDLGILKGAGRRYRITNDNTDRGLVDFDFTVAERWLSKDE